MDVPEANIPTQGSQVGNVETVSNVAWPGSLWQLKLSGQLGQPGMTIDFVSCIYQGGNFVVTQGALTKARTEAAKQRGQESVKDIGQGEGSGAAAEESQARDVEDQMVADKVVKDTV
ncbi:hypothetical protein ACET3Z_018612 [Daucus carota]